MRTHYATTRLNAQDGMDRRIRYHHYAAPFHSVALQALRPHRARPQRTATTCIQVPVANEMRLHACAGREIRPSQQHALGKNASFTTDSPASAFSDASQMPKTQRRTNASCKQKHAWQACFVLTDSPRRCLYCSLSHRNAIPHAQRQRQQIRRQSIALLAHAGNGNV